LAVLLVQPDQSSRVVGAGGQARARHSTCARSGAARRK
jgi:hypothetical protein